MRQRSTRSYFSIALFLVCLLSLPQSVADGWRAHVAALFGPSWNWMNTLAITSQPLGNPTLKTALSRNNRRVVTPRDEIQRLQLENRQLQQQLAQIKAVLFEEQSIQQATQTYAETQDLPEELKAAQQRRRKELLRLLQDRLASLPARVIYRSPGEWNSTLWLNIGDADNKAVDRLVVAKNSPVVLGESLVGVIDLVNAHQSRVRLITDSSLVPAVRAMRQGRLLAKGELHGSSLPLWRHEGRVLAGIGFNYDFADAEGPARDLRNGRPAGEPDGDELALIQVGDLLVTSGLDGVFPPGLHVAEVSSMQPLREGDYFYELSAKPTAGDLDALSLLYVLPPVGFKREM